MHHLMIMGSEMGQIETFWDALSTEERITLIRRDKSMRDPRFALLVIQMSASKFAQMSSVQQDSITYFVSLSKKGRSR